LLFANDVLINDVASKQQCRHPHGKTLREREIWHKGIHDFLTLTRWECSVHEFMWQKFC